MAEPGGPSVSDRSVIDTSESTFQADVIEASHRVPVVVDFWAAWCGPCRILGPILEKLAGEAAGAWILAKLDVDTNPTLAASFRVQGIPAVKAFKDGKEVAEFVGALPENQVRQWLSELGPSPADALLQEGRQAQTEGDVAGAAALYRRVLDLEPFNGHARSLLAKAELTLRAAEADVGELQARMAADPSDVETAEALADALASQDRLDEAFSVLLDMVGATSGDDRDRVRRHLLELMATTSPEDERAVAARRRLSQLLF